MLCLNKVGERFTLNNLKDLIMSRRLALDLETDNLFFDLTKVWVLVAKDLDTGEEFILTSPETIQSFLDTITPSDLLIAHNGAAFDLPVLRKLFKFNYSPTQVYDTLLASRLLCPDLEGGHSLDAWGQRLKFKKTEFKDFSQLSEEMIEYCRNDVAVLEKIFLHLEPRIAKIPKAWKIEQEFIHFIQLQIENGFTLDVPKAEALYQTLHEEHENLTEHLRAQMKPVKDLTHYRGLVNSGLLLNEDELGYNYRTAKTNLIKRKEWKFNHPNPQSRQQIIEFLKDIADWTPEVFTENGQAKVDETILKTIDHPEAQNIARMFRLSKQMGMIRNPNGGWLNYVRESDKVHGQLITIGTNTGRCSHSQPNLGQIDRKDLRMREVWIPKEGFKLVDCDASQLELRLLAHYLARYDGGLYASNFDDPNVDIHTVNQNMAGLRQRDSAKTLIYALVYGAGNAKLGSVIAKDRGIKNPSDRDLMRLGKEARQEIQDNFTGYKELMEDISIAVNERGHLFGVDGRPLHPRSDFSALNLLIQNAGAVVMKVGLNLFMHEMRKRGYKHGREYALVANIHDQITLEATPEVANEVGTLVRDSIRNAGPYLNLKCSLDGAYGVGNNFAEAH